MRNRTTRAFSLIELMIVVAIIAVLASVAVPAYATFACRSKQSEAKINLRAMMTLMQAFRHEQEVQGVVTGDAPCSGPANNPFGFKAVGGSRYNYGMRVDTVNNGGLLLATAGGCKPEVSTDVFAMWEYFSCTNCCIGFTGPVSDVTICRQMGFDQMGLDACR